MHSHHCDHIVRYCRSCDVCYCVECRKEWGKIYFHNYAFPSYSTTGSSAGNISFTGDTTHNHE